MTSVILLLCLKPGLDDHSFLGPWKAPHFVVYQSSTTLYAQQPQKLPKQQSVLPQNASLDGLRNLHAQWQDTVGWFFVVTTSIESPQECRIGPNNTIRCLEAGQFCPARKHITDCRPSIAVCATWRQWHCKQPSSSFQWGHSAIGSAETGIATGSLSYATRWCNSLGLVVITQENHHHASARAASSHEHGTLACTSGHPGR